MPQYKNKNWSENFSFTGTVFGKLQKEASKKNVKETLNEFQSLFQNDANYPVRKMRS